MQFVSISQVIRNQYQFLLNILLFICLNIVHRCEILLILYGKCYLLSMHIIFSILIDFILIFIIIYYLIVIYLYLSLFLVYF